ncbi:MAG: cupin domain-containing protein [Spirochaetales bacterium]|nr:cupin domain-containing protein [Spirochaetales bacterium]MCF7938706.1 cupin domain-containing protein [Spirochaetales bacterium]
MYMVDVRDDIMCKTRSGNKIYWMLTSEIGAQNFELRYIEIPPGGKSSFGQHPHEHEIFVIKGKGLWKGENEETKELLPGNAIFVPGNEVHQWLNASDTEPYGFICVVPKGAEAESKPPCDWK